MMHLDDLLRLLPDDATVERHFHTRSASTGKASPFVIARGMSIEDFDRLCDLLESLDQPPMYSRELELDNDGTLQIPEVAASQWHDCVNEAITLQMQNALTQAGLPKDAIRPYGAGRVRGVGRSPNGNWCPHWSPEERGQILTEWPRSMVPSLDMGTLLIEVAFSEDSDHLRNKIHDVWMKDGTLFPLLVLAIDFIEAASEESILAGEPLDLEVNLYRRLLLDKEAGFHISQSMRVRESVCIEPGMRDFQIRIPTKELLYGLSSSQFIEIDTFEVISSLIDLRSRLKATSRGADPEDM